MKLTNLEALQAQTALGKLGELDLPIKTSLDVAIITNLIEQQTKTYGVVLQNLYKKHSIKTEPNKETGGVNFTCMAKADTDEATGKLRSENLETFADKFNELLEAKTDDMVFKKIKLPDDLKIKPEVLKALVDFVEV